MKSKTFSLESVALEAVLQSSEALKAEQSLVRAYAKLNHAILQKLADVSARLDEANGLLERRNKLRGEE